MIVAFNWKIDPWVVMCNFERGLHNTVSQQFDQRGLYTKWISFPLETSKMKNIAIPEKQVSTAIEKYVIDNLMIIQKLGKVSHVSFSL